MAALTPEEQQALNALLDDYRNTLAQVGQESAAQLERRKAFEKIERQIQQIQTETLTNSAQKLQDINQALRDNNQLQEENQRQLEAYYKELYKSREAGQELDEDAKKILKEQIADLKDKLALNREVNEELEKQQNFQKEIRQQGEDLLGTFTGIKEQQSGVVGLLQKGVNDGKSFGEALSQVGEGIGGRIQEIVTPINVAASITAKIVESTIKLVMETSDALANFNRLTTASGQLDAAIFQASISTKQFGVSLSDAAAAAGELFTSMSSFSQMTAEAAKETIVLAAAMERAGLTTRDFGQIADLAMKGFGMSQEESFGIVEELLGVSQRLRIPMAQLGADFTSSMAELAKHGPKGIEVFEELAAMAKAAGVEVSTLLGIAGQFDTIETAAQATSRLNAILGSTLNTVQLLNATESERIMLIKQSVDATGQSFGSMDRFKQQAIANAAGIKNMADANKLFNTSGAKFREELAKLTGEAGDLSAATSASTSIADRFKLMIESLAIAVLPLVSVISTLTQLLVVILTPVNMLFNGLSIVGEKFAEVTGQGKEFGDNVTGVLMLISGVIAYVSYQAITLGLSFGQAFSAGILTSMKLFATNIYTNVIAPLGAGILTALKFAGTLLVKVVGAFAAGIASALAFAGAMIGSVVLALGLATLKVLAFTAALLANPIVLIGVAIAAVAFLIYDNFEMVFDFMMSGFTMVGDAFSAVGDAIMFVIGGITGAFTGFINLFVSGINFFIGALNSISFTVPDFVPFVGGEEFGINIPLIPMLEEGGQISEDGTAYLHAGEKVIPAAKVEQLDNVVEVATNMVSAVPLLTMGTMMNPVGAAAMMGVAAVGAFATEEGGGNADLLVAIKENTSAMKELLTATGANAGGQQTVVLELNERQLGKVMVDSLNNRQSMRVEKA